MEIENANVATITMETEIDAPPETVWAALTNNIGEWWPASFYVGGEAGKRNFHLEAKPGGRMYEDWNNGGNLWGTVICAEPNALLQVLGQVFPNWGGPTEWYGTWKLTAKGKGTMLSFSESEIGRVSESGLAEKDKGWSFLWQTMKAHVEGKPAPVWED